MKRTLLAFIIAFPLNLEAQHEDVFRKIDFEVRNHSKVYETLQEAVKTIGHRLTGSENGKKAEEFAYQLFKTYGFKNVSFQPFEVEAWTRDTVTLSIAPGNSDNYREVPVVGLAHTPLSAQIKGEIIDVGNGLEEDFQKLDEKIKGKVVLTNLGLVGAPGKKNIHRSQKTALAIRYGAIGIIFINSAPGDILLTGTASVDGSLIAIPAVCISNQSGKEIRLWAQEESPMVAEIEMSNQSRKVQARNIIATMKGKSKETIVIGGHLDSWDLAQGAIDNGIGSFAVIDIARTFQKLNFKPEKTIEFVLFMGEEQGLLGSRHYVNELKRKKQLDQVAYMINLDMTNNPNGTIAYGRTEAETFLKNIGSIAAQIDTTYENKFNGAAGLHSDHQPFMLNGIPVMAFSGTLPPKALQCYHADCDYFDLVNKEEVEKTVRIASMYLYALSTSQHLPAKRLSPSETRDLMVNQGLKDALKLGNDWNWD